MEKWAKREINAFKELLDREIETLRSDLQCMTDTLNAFQFQIISQGSRLTHIKDIEVIEERLTTL